MIGQVSTNICHQERFDLKPLFNLEDSLYNLNTVAYILLAKMWPHLTTFAECCRSLMRHINSLSRVVLISNHDVVISLISANLTAESYTSMCIVSKVIPKTDGCIKGLSLIFLWKKLPPAIGIPDIRKSSG